MWPEELAEYRRYKEDLSVLNVVIMFRSQVVVPRFLRQDVLDALHCAHQGATGMGLRAVDMVWLPGLMADLQRCQGVVWKVCEKIT